jgi:hypothetical protein
MMGKGGADEGSVSSIQSGRDGRRSKMEWKRLQVAAQVIKAQGVEVVLLREAETRALNGHGGEISLSLLQETSRGSGRKSQRQTTQKDGSAPKCSDAVANNLPRADSVFPGLDETFKRSRCLRIGRMENPKFIREAKRNDGYDDPV